MVTEEQIEDASDQAEAAVSTLRQAIRDRDNHFAELDCLIGSQAHRIKGMNKRIKELGQKVVELLTVRDWLNERNTKLAEEVKQHEDNYNHEQLCRAFVSNLADTACLCEAVGDLGVAECNCFACRARRLKDELEHPMQMLFGEMESDIDKAAIGDGLEGIDYGTCSECGTLLTGDDDWKANPPMCNHCPRPTCAADPSLTTCTSICHDCKEEILGADASFVEEGMRYLPHCKVCYEKHDRARNPHKYSPK